MFTIYMIGMIRYLHIRKRKFERENAFITALSRNTFSYLLHGADGDTLHAEVCVANFSHRWLLRVISKMGVVAVLLVLAALALVAGTVSPTNSKPQAD